MTSASGNSQPQDAELPQCWKDIKNETGFLTYAEYSNAYRDAHRQDKLVGALKEYYNDGRDGTVIGYCSIWHIFGTGTLSSCYTGPLLGSNVSSINVLTSLRNPDSDAILRVILLEPGARNSSLTSFITDVFGLGLRIVPEFFGAYLARSGIIQDYSPEVSLGEGSGFLGDSLITVARDYLPGRSKYPPVLLIMAEQFMLENLQPVLFYPQGVAESRWVQSCKLFEKVIEESLKRYQSQIITLDVALIHSLLPLLKCSLKQLKASLDRAKDEYLGRFTGISTKSPSMKQSLKNPEEAMEATRFKLRRQLRRFEDCMSDLNRIFRDQHITNPERYRAFSLLIEGSHESLNDAYALESEIRDWLQLRVSSLALEESKKSMEVSNLQIEESKRGTIMKFRFDVVF